MIRLALQNFGQLGGRLARLELRVQKVCIPERLSGFRRIAFTARNLLGGGCVDRAN
jgi:hypothetical protein